MSDFILLRSREIANGAPASTNQGHFRIVKNDQYAAEPEWVQVAQGSQEDLVAAINSSKPFPSGEDESTRAAWVRRRIREIDPPAPKPKPRVTQGSPPPPFRGRARWENIQGHYDQEKIAVEPLVSASKAVLTMTAVVLGGAMVWHALFLLLTAHAQDRFQNDIYANPDWQIWKGVGLIALALALVAGAFWWEFIREPQSPGALRRFVQRVDSAIWSAATAPARYVRGVRSKYPDHGLFPALWEDLFGRPG